MPIGGPVPALIDTDLLADGKAGQFAEEVTRLVLQYLRPRRRSNERTQDWRE
jgi:hypothetical protein